jgi:hypothetical protein
MIFQAAIRDKNGVVHIGKRHDNILNGAKPSGALKGCEQGFIDTDGNFLDREAAGKHAIACGQIKSLKYQRRDLFSEELW